MKVITTLTAEAAEAQFQITGGVMQQVIEEVAKGSFRSTKLGKEGLVLKRGGTQVAIPLATLWDCATQIEPDLRAPAIATPA